MSDHPKKDSLDIISQGELVWYGLWAFIIGVIYLSRGFASNDSLAYFIGILGTLLAGLVWDTYWRRRDFIRKNAERAEANDAE